MDRETKLFNIVEELIEVVRHLQNRSDDYHQRLQILEEEAFSNPECGDEGKRFIRRKYLNE